MNQELRKLPAFVSERHLNSVTSQQGVLSAISDNMSTPEGHTDITWSSLLLHVPKQIPQTTLIVLGAMVGTAQGTNN